MEGRSHLHTTLTALAPAAAQIQSPAPERRGHVALLSAV